MRKGSAMAVAEFWCDPKEEGRLAFAEFYTGGEIWGDRSGAKKGGILVRPRRCYVSGQEITALLFSFGRHAARLIAEFLLAAEGIASMDVMEAAMMMVKLLSQSVWSLTPNFEGS